MKRQSRFTLLFGMLLFPLLGWSQTSFQVDGFVLNSSGVGMDSVTVWLDYPLQGGGFDTDTTVTISNGYFDFGTINAASQGFMLLMAECALNNYVLDTLLFDPTTTAWTSTLTCGQINTGPCDPTFTATPQPTLFNPYAVFIQPTANNQPNANYYWNLGFGQGFNSGGGLFTFPGPGTYNICVTVTNGTCVDSSCQTITLTNSNPCNAQFFNWLSGSTNYFIADSSNFSPSTTYTWDLGDGTIATGVSVTHNYAIPDSYYVCLTVNDPVNGCIDSTCQWISAVFAPTCQAFAQITNITGDTLEFQVTGATGVAPFSYSWDFGDGSSPSTNPNPIHVYPGPGVYVACLTVTDATGCTSTDCIVVTVGSSTGCDASFFTLPFGGSSFHFAALDSSLAPGSYYWDFGDGSMGSGPYVNHTYNTTDSFLVCLIVIDQQTGCTDTSCQYVVSQAGPSCAAAFTYQVSGSGQFHFVNQSTGVTPNSSFFWDLGDGSTSTSINPAHFYSSPGTYNVCLYIQTPTCSDSICQTITVTGAPNNCSASFTAQDQGNGVWVFTADSAIAGAIYSVDPGDGSNWVFGGPALTHQYTASGTYLVCFSVLDSLNNCTATSCDTISVQVAGPVCQAGFTYSAAALSNTFLFADSSVSSSGGPLSYFWDFGDSTTSTLANPTHTYSTPGPWYVCLTVTDAGGCTSTWCDIVFPVNIPGTFNVSGIIVTDSLLGTQSFVYLIQHDSIANTLTAVDSQFAQFGFYQFNNVYPGSYLVKAGLTPASPQYANYLPTYHGDVLMWNQAIATIVTNSDVWNLPITLVQGNNPGGPGFIGGLISQGANKDGDPLPDISVVLMTIAEEPVTHTLTNQDGEYGFSNLAYGTYIVHVEIPGKPAEDWIVTLDANNPSFTLGDFDVHTDHIDAVGTTSIVSGLDPNSVRVYPNPSAGLVNIALDLNTNSARIELINGLGAVVERVTTVGGSTTEQMNLSNLADGVYLIRVSTSEGTLTQRLVKQ